MQRYHTTQNNTKHHHDTDTGRIIHVITHQQIKSTDNTSANTFPYATVNNLPFLVYWQLLHTVHTYFRAVNTVEKLLIYFYTSVFTSQQHGVCKQMRIAGCYALLTVNVNCKHTDIHCAHAKWIQPHFRTSCQTETQTWQNNRSCCHG